MPMNTLRTIQGFKCVQYGICLPSSLNVESEYTGGDTKVITETEYKDVVPKVDTEADFTQIKVGKNPERPHGFLVCVCEWSQL